MNTNWVRLNVGGEIFLTTKQTLSSRRDSFLARLIANADKFASDTDHNGAILIDRNPKYFALILDFLRNGGRVNNDIGGKNTNWEGLRYEAEFFGLSDLVNLCKEKIQEIPTDWVRLNVGGKIFLTTKQTLSSRPFSFLALLIANDDKKACNMDSTGAIMIDRNPDHFSSILDFLRNGGKVNGIFVGTTSIWSGNKTQWDALRQEAEFFGLPDLVKTCDEQMWKSKCVLY